MISRKLHPLKTFLAFCWLAGLFPLSVAAIEKFDSGRSLYEELSFFAGFEIVQLAVIAVWAALGLPLLLVWLADRRDASAPRTPNGVRMPPYPVSYARRVA